MPKKPPKKKVDPLADIPEEIKQLSMEDLQNEIETMRTRLVDSRVRRNYIQNEKEAIKKFYEISLKQAEDVDSKVRNQETLMQELDDNHRVEVKVYAQKIKHLEYDHKNELVKTAADGRRVMRDEDNDHIMTQNMAKKEKVDVRKQIKETELANIDYVDRQHEKHERALTKLRESYDINLRALEQKYQEKLDRLSEDLELRLKVEVHEIEERKNKHRNELMANHERSFRDLKNYYNEITRGNLELIRSQKEEKKQLEQRHRDNMTAIGELEEEIKDLESPLTAAKAELETLIVQLANYEMDKISLKNAKNRLKSLMKKLENCRYEKTELEEKYKLVCLERDQLLKQFEESIDRLKEKNDYKNVYLSQRLMDLEQSLTQKEAQLQEILRRSNIEPQFVLEISKRIEESLEAKNTILKNLTYSLAHATKAYNDAIRVYEAKLIEFGIPAEELGFQPIQTDTSTMPAGLVAA